MTTNTAPSPADDQSKTSYMKHACLTCSHWLLKESALQGFGLCALGNRWTYFPKTHSCTKHTLATTAEGIAA